MLDTAAVSLKSSAPGYRKDISHSVLFSPGSSAIGLPEVEKDAMHKVYYDGLPREIFCCLSVLVPQIAACMA